MFVYLQSRDLLLCSNTSFILDKQARDVCEQSVLFVASVGEVHGTWERDENDQASKGKCVQVRMLAK
jgi:hypothetical protein